MSDEAGSQSPNMLTIGENTAAAQLAKRESQLATLRAKYNIPPSVIMRVPEIGKKVSEPDEDELGFFDEALTAGCRFPLSREIR
ncbi:hypothetical protein CJ030_MR8G004872 [Morella rubra]|uniref:Uncharacterized protein n=1 Tax=Morella rubra TaxID=262757 RepID=A0A6A1UWC9_9ROSI|nr:hypothetical protein CJ030_MR8G004872 [Morella rubra]